MLVWLVVPFYDFCKQLTKVHNSSLNTTYSARNLVFIFDEHLIFSDQISSLSPNLAIHYVCPYLDSKTASITVTSIVHFKHYYCNSFYYNLPQSHMIQEIQNCLEHAVVKASKSCHTTPIFCTLQWLKITERIKFKLLSLAGKVLTTTRPSYLHNLITCSASSQHSLFISHHSRSTTNIMLVRNN